MSDSFFHPAEQDLTDLSLHEPWMEDASVKARLAEMSPNQQRIFRSLNAKSAMIAASATWVLAAATGALAPAHARAAETAQASPTISVMHVSPAMSGLAQDGIPRSIISPNGDNLNDVVAYTLQTTPGAEVMMTVNYWMGGQTQIVTLGPVRANDQGIAVLAWDGKDSDGKLVGDGGYNLTFCHPGENLPAITTPPIPPGHLLGAGLQCGCGIVEKIVELRTASSISVQGAGCGGSPQAAVNVNTLSVTTPGHMVRSANSGSDISLNIDSDQPGAVFHARLVDEDAGDVVPVGRQIMDYGNLSAGSNTIHIPEGLRPAEYRIIVDDKIGDHRQVPLVVTSPGSYGINTPPAAGTALVIVPTLTWRAYSFADAGLDGFSDTWYSMPKTGRGQANHSQTDNTVSLTTPYQTSRTGLGGISGSEIDQLDASGYWRVYNAHPEWKTQVVTDYEFGLMHANVVKQYSALFFPGHTEYYTNGMYDNANGFKRSGGHMAFYESNNFYSSVVVNETDQTEQMTFRPNPGKVEPERQEFALMGNGYRYCCVPMYGGADAVKNTYYYVPQAGMTTTPWLYANTGLNVGDPFSLYGGEVDTQVPGVSPTGGTLVGTANPVYQGYDGKMHSETTGMLWLPPSLDHSTGAVFSTGSFLLPFSVYATEGPNQKAAAQILVNVHNYLTTLPHVPENAWLRTGLSTFATKQKVWPKKIAWTTTKLTRQNARTTQTTPAMFALVGYGHLTRQQTKTIARTRNVELSLAVKLLPKASAKTRRLFAAALVQTHGEPVAVAAVLKKYRVK